MPLPQHVYKASPSGESLFYSWFSAMHTRVDIAFHGTHSEADLLALTGDIRREIGRIEQMGNCFDPASELAYVNRTAYNLEVGLSEELYGILQHCQEAHAQTLGCFDITVQSQPHTPDTPQAVLLSSSRRTVRFAQPGIHLNLSGFLKGYALDKLRPILQQGGIRHALVNLGNSSILALGNHPAGEGWKLDRGIILHDQCLTTSGNDSPERRHIINPHTGSPVTGIQQIRVVTPDGTSGEIFSTALFAADRNQRGQLVERLKPQLIHYEETF